MRLHGSRTSPYVRKVRVTLDEAGVPFEFAICDVWRRDSHVPGLNPLGKVPVLETGEGDVLFDSFAIADYMDRLAGGFLIPSNGDTRRDVLWWHALGHGIIDAAVVEVLERRRPPELQSERQIAHERARIARALRTADSGVAGSTFLCGPRITLADITLAVALQYLDFRLPCPWREDHPALSAWLAAISQRASLARSLPPEC